MRAPTAAIALLLAGALAGCSTASGGLLDDYNAGDDGGNYVSGDGTTTAIVAENRGEPIEFAGETELGDAVSSEELLGRVVLVNFWYSTCPPCRIEAPDLERLHLDYLDDEVTFLGVNVRDDAATTRTFAAEFGITYPSIVDAATNDVQLAFAGKIAPNAVPTTLVLDREGRVAARISGLVSDPGLLAQFIDDALAEEL